MENFILSEKEQNNFKALEAGSYPAKLVALIDLGAQTSEFEGEVKKQKKIRLRFEVSEPLNDTENYSISKDFVFSFHEKSALRKFLQVWRGKAFTADELKAFDLMTLLGVPALLAVSNKESKKGRTYASLDSASILPKGMTPFANKIEPFMFLISKPENWSKLTAYEQGLVLEGLVLESAEGKASGLVATNPTEKTETTGDGKLPF